MSQLLRLFLAIALGLASLVHSYSDPGSCTGACWAHDPSIIQRASDGKYFKFNTGTGIEIATADSLAGPWTLQGYVLASGSSIDNPGKNDPWAPDVHLVGEEYYLYYAVSEFGSQVSAIGLATSPTMQPGTWTDQGGVGVVSKKGQAYNAIDPNLVAVGSDYYLNFGSFWGDIYQVKLNSAATKATSAATHNIEYDSAGTRPCEGSYMFFYNNYYYLLWSHGICCGYDKTLPAPGDEYRIMMCRSKTATGGFLDQNGVACTASGGSILLESHGSVYGPGGQGVFTDSSKELVLYYHYANKSIGLGDGDYRFGWNVLNWSTDGWPQV